MEHDRAERREPGDPSLRLDPYCRSWRFRFADHERDRVHQLRPYWRRADHLRLDGDRGFWQHVHQCCECRADCLCGLRRDWRNWRFLGPRFVFDRHRHPACPWPAWSDGRSCCSLHLHPGEPRCSDGPWLFGDCERPGCGLSDPWNREPSDWNYWRHALLRRHRDRQHITLSTTTANGSPVNTSAVGSGILYKATPLVISCGVTPCIAASAMVLQAA